MHPKTKRQREKPHSNTKRIEREEREKKRKAKRNDK